MSNRYSQIDIYEKGEYQNAFPLRINFPLILTNYTYGKKNIEEVCEFITNNASFAFITLKNNNGNSITCHATNIFNCSAKI